MTLNCVIIDDEPLAVSLLESYVAKTPFLALKGSYSSAVAALDEIRRGKVDVIFLDIQMPELDGLAFAQMVPEGIRIVFTTAFGQYALEGFRVNALDYLLKPISYAAFLEAADRALEWFMLKQGTADEADAPPAAGGCIFVKSDYKLLLVDLDDILYIEGLKDYVKIHTESAPRPILSLSSMKTMEERLPAGRFIRVHRSFIVQKSKIKVIERNRIVFGQACIPISDSYKQEWQAFLDELSL